MYYCLVYCQSQLATGLEYAHFGMEATGAVFWKMAQPAEIAASGGLMLYTAFPVRAGYGVTGTVMGKEFALQGQQKRKAAAVVQRKQGHALLLAHGEVGVHVVEEVLVQLDKQRHRHVVLVAHNQGHALLLAHGVSGAVV